jgi:hypothetical protein
MLWKETQRKSKPGGILSRSERRSPPSERQGEQTPGERGLAAMGSQRRLWAYRE